MNSCLSRPTKNNLHNCVKVSYKCFAYRIFRTSALSNPPSHSFATSSYYFWIIRKKAVNLIQFACFRTDWNFRRHWALLAKPGSNSNTNLAWKRIPEAGTGAPVVFSNTVAANVDVRVCRHLLLILMLNVQWKRRDISRIAEVDTGPAAGMIDSLPHALNYNESWE